MARRPGKTRPFRPALSAFLVVCALRAPAHATCTGGGSSWSCTAGSTPAQIQSAVNGAADGATIILANGNYNLSSSIALDARNGVSILCASVGGCNISMSNDVFTLSSCSGPRPNLFRISGFNFSGTVGTAAVWLFCNQDLQQVRVDHNDFSIGQDQMAVLFGEVTHTGRAFGVVDHNNCHSGTVNFLCMKNISGAASTWMTGAAGTSNNMFFEDNVCNFSSMPNNGTGCIDVWRGNGTVARFNTMFNGRLVNHSYCHEGPYNSEVYGNAINTPGDFAPEYRNIHFQGSGEEIAFGNTIGVNGGNALVIQHFRGDPATATNEGACNSLCDGTVTGSGADAPHANDGNRPGQLGYPCWRQPGRDVNATLKPVYVFMNKSAQDGSKVDIELNSGGNAPGQIQPDRDYYNAVSGNAQTSPTSPFNGTHGVGFGTLANRPAACTPTPQALDAGHGGVGYWATDQGNWNQSGNGFGQGALYTCVSTNTWSLTYTPYVYPHPLQNANGGGTAPWSGILDPSRAMDWSLAGIPGGPPDAGWPVCATIAPYSGTAKAIVDALAACNSAHPTGGVVALGTGTFALSTGINFPVGTVGHLALRGQGASRTQLNFSGAASGCNGDSAFICAGSNDGTYASNSNATISFTNWTGGYAQGTTRITLAGVSGIVPGKTVLILNQCDTGFSGPDCLSGGPVDNGGYFQCSAAWTGTGMGCAVPSEGPDGPGYRKNAWQLEGALVTAINEGGCGPTCVTLSRPLQHPNWSAGQSPIAILLQIIPQVGVENLSMDGSANLSVAAGVYFWDAWQPWVSGVRIANVFAHSVGLFQSWQGLVQNSYFYGNPGPYNDNTGAHPRYGGDTVVQNNICQQVKLCYMNDGPEVADVVAYNYSVDQYGSGASDYMWFAAANHSAGGDFQLFEGNAQNNRLDDSDHGGHLNQTSFRNFFWGWESCANGQCGSNTQKNSEVMAVGTSYGTRYSAYVANVLGTPGYHTSYQTTNNFWNSNIYQLGVGNQAEPPDALSLSTMLRWGNWDTVTDATRWCGGPGDTGWSTVCGSVSEVPTGAPTYPNPVPSLGDTGAGMGALPPSFYLPSRPSWFGAIPWPAIGPDVNGGTVGQCSGALNVPGKFNGLAATSASQCAGSGITAGAWSGHVYANPAMNCYLNVMGGRPDGTGGVLPFDPNSCYAGGGGDTTPPSVAISSPANGATVSGTIAVSGTATDNVSVSNVAISIDGGAYSPASGTASWSFALNTTALSNAAHTITAKATDSSGNTATTSISVTVNNAGGGDTTPPTVSISTPADGSNVSGTVTLSANASDNVGVVQVDFYADGAKFATVKSPPYAASWKTTNKKNGTAHVLTTAALDAAGNQATASATVTVRNPLSANAAVPGLRSAYAYPSPAGRGQDPVIRALLGWADGVEVSIYDLNGRLMNSAKLDGAPTGIMNGEYYYDYPWTGAKSSGVYFAVIHGKSSDGTVVRARVKFAVVR